MNRVYSLPHITHKPLLQVFRIIMGVYGSSSAVTRLLYYERQKRSLKTPIISSVTLENSYKERNYKKERKTKL